MALIGTGWSGKWIWPEAGLGCAGGMGVGAAQVTHLLPGKVARQSFAAARAQTEFGHAH
jgi:hypothetical protein